MHVKKWSPNNFTVECKTGYKTYLQKLVRAAHITTVLMHIRPADKKTIHMHVRTGHMHNNNDNWSQDKSTDNCTAASIN